MKNRYNFNCWRALAHNRFGGQHLLYMGSSQEQVRKNFPGSFYEILTVSEQYSLNRIILERWIGSQERGKWVPTDVLKIPKINKTI